jgi:hypothetical protein
LEQLNQNTLRMNKLFLSLLFVGFCCATARAQDAGVSRANAYFSQAQTAFDLGNYKECLDDIDKTELELKGSKPATMYLKIKAQFALFKVDGSYQKELADNFNKFDHMIDITSYDPDKYHEIQDLHTKFNDMVAGQQLSFLRGRIDSTKALLTKYESKKFRPYWPIFGGICVAGGAYFLLSSISNSLIGRDSTPIYTRTGTQINISGYNYYADSTKYNNKKSQNKTVGIAVASLGGAILIAYFTREIIIKGKIRKYKAQLDAMQNKKTMTLIPNVDFGPGRYSVGFVLNF